MPKRLPIKSAQEVADKYDLRQVILVAWDGKRTHVVTYGKSDIDGDQVAMGGDLVKKAIGFPKDTWNLLPSRVKKLQVEVARLRQELEGK